MPWRRPRRAHPRNDVWLWLTITGIAASCCDATRPTGTWPPEPVKAGTPARRPAADKAMARGPGPLAPAPGAAAPGGEPATKVTVGAGRAAGPGVGTLAGSTAKEAQAFGTCDEQKRSTCHLSALLLATAPAAPLMRTSAAARPRTDPSTPLGPPWRCR
eukprot:CAMPEP_0204112490 /NCGR_PEP_ID=MMETSP0361-20130328/3097_1 /ASSEMBLY_ACC=CAM_ASM_000343 /TAXON_ID=268821 /ORGANISM="Scrippsiella Hangoei, Strain SHTV-5" /LENGTH=158 /DNA_ID=CAMNT_0051062711 /DNA_START=109 /DNA_END=583 /DNA_ORIENTATION=+